MLTLLLTLACTRPTPTPPVTTPPPAPPACSAASLSPALPTQPLPAPVATTRARIAELAAACDIDGLAALAQEGLAPFSFSFGGATDPAAYWRQAEDAGEAPLAALVRLLALTPCVNSGPGGDIHQWPAASCGTPTDAQLAELSGLYTEEELASFREYGAYLGWRVGVRPDGDWIFFVAGD